MNVSPQNMELMVVSSIFYNYDLIHETILSSADFTTPNLGKIFYTMQKLAKEELPIDEDFIKNRLPKKELDKFESLLLDIMVVTPVTNIKAYEIEIKENAKKRALEELINSSKKLLEEKSTKEVLKSISKEIEALEDDYKTNSILNLKEIKDIEVELPNFLLVNTLPIQENEINIFSANGGSGKSYLIAYLLLELAEIGKKSFAWFSEDSLGVTKNRLLKLLNVHTHLELSNITIAGKENQPLQFVERTSKKLEINEKFEKLKKELKEYDIIVLDPLIAFYGGDENNNSEARYFMALLNKWCEDDKKTIVLIHHNNKADKDGKSTSRGASAFIDACRMQYSVYGKEGDSRYRIAKVEKSNHFTGKKEFEIKLFDTQIIFEKPKEVIEKEEKTKNKHSSNSRYAAALDN